MAVGNVSCARAYSHGTGYEHRKRICCRGHTHPALKHGPRDLANFEFNFSPPCRIRLVALGNLDSEQTCSTTHAPLAPRQNYFRPQGAQRLCRARAKIGLFHRMAGHVGHRVLHLRPVDAVRDRSGRDQLRQQASNHTQSFLYSL